VPDPQTLHLSFKLTSTCTFIAQTIANWNVPNPGIGDVCYMFSPGCDLGVVRDGYYVLNLSGTYRVVQIVNSTIVSFPSCL
jgi:hypothetical protein